MTDRDEEDWFEAAVESDGESEREQRQDDDDSAPEREDGEESRPAGEEPTDRDTQPPDGEPTDGNEDRESLFEQDFASALGDAPETGGGSPVGGAGPGGEEAFGMGTEGEGEFGMGGGEFGLGGGTEQFDEDEPLDTDIDRIDLGIGGLDDMIQGGVPERSLMVAIGSAGTGKTTFGIQFLDEELRKEEGGNAVFITLEESRERILKSATEKGFPFDRYSEEGRLAIVDLDPIEMANSLATIRSELPRLIRDFDATRLVLDSVSLLEMMYDSRATRRNEIYDFTRSLKQSGVTTMLTSEADADSAYTSRYGIVEYLTDAVFVLQYVRPSDFRKTRLAVEIQKIRDANHSRETKPYEITSSGISVYRQASIF